MTLSITYSDQYVTSHCSEYLSSVYVSYKKLKSCNLQLHEIQTKKGSTQHRHDQPNQQSPHCYSCSPAQLLWAEFCYGHDPLKNHLSASALSLRSSDLMCNWILSMAVVIFTPCSEGALREPNHTLYQSLRICNCAFTHYSQAVVPASIASW